MPFIDIPQSVVNIGSLAGDQSRGHVATLASGGFAVFWTDPVSPTTNIFLQRYDAFGNAVGSATDTGLSGSLNDLCLTDSGNVALALTLTNGTTARVAILNGTTLALIGSSSQAAGGTINSMQIDASGGDNVRLILTDTAGTVRQGLGNAGGGSLSLATITTVTAGTTLADLTSTSTASIDFGLLSNGNLITQGGSTLNTSFPVALDLMQLQPGFYVMATAPGFDSMTPQLVAINGPANATTFGQLSVGASVSGGFVNGTGSQTGAEVTGCELVNLGDGRILVIWGAFRGTGGFTGQSGIYASVYNAAIGGVESSGALLRSAGGLDQLEDTTINASVMADGRVAVTLTTSNGLSGDDVFRIVVDARAEGVVVTGTSVADSYLGTALDDTFANIHINDTVQGGAGIDTIITAGSGARSIDLANPNAFPGGPTLDSIENVTTSSGNDIVYGTGGANVLDGAAGNDLLVGRDGNDSLLGGNGNDTLDGGLGSDTLDGGQNNDRIIGAGGADVLFGSAGNDTVHGGEGDDLIQGGDNDDALDGGIGADTLYGGLGADTLTTGTGEDVVFGGDGNDVIYAIGSGNVIAGEAGIDRVIFSGTTIGPNQVGVYADLADLFDPLASQLGFDPDGNTYTGVENITGSRGNDFLAGDSAANRLHGGTGDDFLLGRGGTDTLIGGEGIDTFVFDAVVAANDSVREFTPGADRIGLLLDVFGDIDAGNIGTRFVASAGATPAANNSAQFLFDNAGPGAGRLFFDADGNGAGGPVLIATITFATANGLTTFGPADFLFL